jgi:hypothetical protein
MGQCLDFFQGVGIQWPSKRRFEWGNGEKDSLLAPESQPFVNMLVHVLNTHTTIQKLYVNSPP